MSEERKVEVWGGDRWRPAGTAQVVRYIGWEALARTLFYLRQRVAVLEGYLPDTYTDDMAELMTLRTLIADLQQMYTERNA